MPVPSARILLVRLLILVLVLASILLLSSSRVDAAQPLVTVEYRVASGDTLWGIAGAVTEPGADPRAAVEMIREINELDGTTIRPGQVLRVPSG